MLTNILSIHDFDFRLTRGRIVFVDTTNVKEPGRPFWDLLLPEVAFVVPITVLHPGFNLLPGLRTIGRIIEISPGWKRAKICIYENSVDLHR